MFYSKQLAFVAVLAIFPCAAQTPAELLQKGIYTQETLGDPDAAIQIYRQILTAAPTQSPVAAQAQYRIAETLLQKGDLSGAALEFNILATRHSEQQALIAKMAERLSGVIRHPAGTFTNGRYKNKRTGLEIAIAAPWKPTYDGASSDNGDMVGLTDGTSIDFGVWMIPEVSTAAQIQEKLRNSVAEKVKMNKGMPGFAFRPETIQPRVISGRQALSAVAEYVENGKKLAAAYTWIFTEKTHVVFLARAIPMDDLASAQARLDQLVSSALVP
ncbi:MAG TPA: tetratricopeptide repeat protein [Candidatus Sulfopaludibacter sp.]|jgi:hypothetical protein|nr:tetratricopeptide repeat protein [Candidatus Sulfopaludibacter sp.]